MSVTNQRRPELWQNRYLHWGMMCPAQRDQPRSSGLSPWLLSQDHSSHDWWCGLPQDKLHKAGWLISHSRAGPKLPRIAARHPISTATVMEATRSIGYISNNLFISDRVGTTVKFYQPCMHKEEEEENRLIARLAAIIFHDLQTLQSLITQTDYTIRSQWWLN